MAATRDPEKLGRFGWCDQVSAVMLDAGDPSVVEAAFAVAGPVDVVYYLVHGIGQAGRQKIMEPFFRNKADVLALGLFGNRQTVLPRKLPDFILGILGKRKEAVL